MKLGKFKKRWIFYGIGVFFFLSGLFAVLGTGGDYRFLRGMTNQMSAEGVKMKAKYEEKNGKKYTSALEPVLPVVDKLPEIYAVYNYVRGAGSILFGSLILGGTYLFTRRKSGKNVPAAEPVSSR